jgi:serpin B
LKSTKENFLAEPVATDFSKGEEARDTINTWVENQTNSKIKDLIAKNVLNGLTKMVLVNAIHFKGDWAMKFKKENTQKGDFHVSKDKVVQADMMFSNEKYPYIPLKDLKAEAIEIPYKGLRLSMILLLPRPDSSLEELEKSLEKFPDIKTVLKFPPLPGRSKVELTLPKFKLETQLELNDKLKAMGITDMFDEKQADFSKMRSGGKKDLYVSKVVQKAFIEVNEDGTEAAAATAGIMMMRAMVINPSFTCDRPFMFMIRDHLTGVTLFSGHVTDPTSQ